jgi:hypothetical protein
MKTTQEYKGCIIDTQPEELSDGSGWIEGCIIKLNKFEGIWLGSDRKFQTREAADAASILTAKRRIDCSKPGSVENTECDSDLSATWSEAEDFRPIIQGDPDPLTGDGGLRWLKEKRRPGLDGLEGEPE